MGQLELRGWRRRSCQCPCVLLTRRRGRFDVVTTRPRESSLNRIAVARMSHVAYFRQRRTIMSIIVLWVPASSDRKITNLPPASWQASFWTSVLPALPTYLYICKFWQITNGNASSSRLTSPSFILSNLMIYRLFKMPHFYPTMLKANWRNCLSHVCMHSSHVFLARIFSPFRVKMLGLIQIN